MSSVTFIMCSVEWVQPNSAGSNKNTSWYLARSWWAASASPGIQESKPLKSNSLDNIPCLCLTVSHGVWGPWGSSTPSCNWASSGGLGTGNTATALATWFSLGVSASTPYCSLAPQLLFTFLSQFSSV